MAITYNITNNVQSIQPGETIQFTPVGTDPVSSNPAVGAISATSASVNNSSNGWVAFLTDAATNSFQVTAPANAQPGDDGTVTINFAGFDNAGNIIDTGTGTVTFTVPNNSFDCAIDDQVMVAGQDLQLPANLFNAAGRGLSIRAFPAALNGLVTVTTQNVNGAVQNVLNIDQSIPNGDHQITVRIVPQPQNGDFCDITFKVTQGTVSTGDCVPLTKDIDQEAISIFAGEFRDGNSANYSTVVSIANVSPAANASSVQRNLAGSIGKIDVGLSLPAGTTTADVTVATADGQQCTTTLTINKQGGANFTCNTVGPFTNDFGTPANIFANAFNTDARIFQSVSITGGALSDLEVIRRDPNDSTRDVDELRFLSTLPIGIYQVTVIVSDEDDTNRCEQTFQITNGNVVNVGDNIVDCINNPPQWVNGTPNVPCGEVSDVQIRLYNVDGGLLNVPASQVSIVYTGSANGVSLIADQNLGNGVYNVRIDATGAQCNGITQVSANISASAT